MSAPLDPFGSVTNIGGLSLRTPGLAGEAEYFPPGAGGMRAVEETSNEFEAALANQQIETQHVIEIREAREVSVPGVATRSAPLGEVAMELEVPDPGDGWGQVVLYTDESGTMTWHFSRNENGQPDVSRGAVTRTYLIPRAVSESGDTGKSRGLIGAIGKKLFKVLAFPLVAPIIGKVGDFFAHRWEVNHRAYRVRTFTPDNFSTEDCASFDENDWRQMSGGRALLMIHGTLSRTPIAFGALSKPYVESLHRKYEGRVFAFDHFTLSEGPKQNILKFLELMPDGLSLDLDIICHSRGGLVARQLAERQGDFLLGSREIRINRIVFVAVPNSGTVLADTQYMGDFIDSYTNLINFFPENGLTETLDGILTIVKQLAVNTVKGLDGLQSMLPAGSFLQQLNQGGFKDKQYFALSSNFEPTVAGWKSYAADHLMDKIFKSENDLVVPTAGVYDRNGSVLFPIQDRHVFGPADGVPHTGFFGNVTAQTKIIQWLS